MAPSILITNPSPDLYGAPRMVLESAQSFRDAGWTVTVALPSGDGPLPDALRSCGASVEICASPVLRKTLLNPRGALRLVGLTLRAVPDAVRLLRRVRPDVVYVNTLTDPFWIVAARLARRPVVAHVHEAETNAPAAVRRAMAAPLLLCSRVVVNSRFCTDVLLRSWPRLESRAVVIRNGVRGPLAPVAPRTRIDLPVRLAFVGRLSERKGVHDAVEAVIELRHRGVDVRLDVVGDAFPGYEWFTAGLLDRVRSAGVTDHVHFHGFAEDVWRHLADCDIALVPSRLDESYGNAAVEAALAARPVVISRLAGLMEATAAVGSVTTVNPGSPGEIADAVESIVVDWDEQRAAAVAAAPRVADLHAPEEYRRSVVETVASCLSIR